jgi:hypothetical protein
MLRRLPRGLADHSQLLLGYQEQIKGWKPFRFLDCRLTHPQFFIGSVGNDRKVVSFCSVDIGTMFKFCAL